LYLTSLWENNEEERQAVLRDDPKNVYDIFIKAFLKYAKGVQLGLETEKDNAIRLYSSFLKITVDTELPFSIKIVKSAIPSVLVQFMLKLVI